MCASNGSEPAFPALESLWENKEGGGYSAQIGGGLTKREYFAGLALQASIYSGIAPITSALQRGGEKPTATQGENLRKSIVSMAVAFADELLEELEKTHA